MQSKGDDGIIELIQVVEHTQLLTPLGIFLRSVYRRCQIEAALIHTDPHQGS